MNRFIFLTLFFLVHTTVFSYEFTPNDTISKHLFFPKKYGNKKWRTMAAIDIKRSFNANLEVGIYGIKAGIEHNGIERINIGISTFAAPDKSPIIASLYIKNPLNNNYNDLRYRSTFGSLFYERAIFRSPRWEIAIPNYFYIGKIKSSYLNLSNNTINELNDTPFLAFATGLQLQYYIFHWIAPKISIGYRSFFNTNPEIKKNFSTPYFGISARVFWNYLFEHFYKRKNLPVDHKDFWEH